LHNNTGEDAYPERSDRNTDAYLKRIASGSKMCIMGREVVVTVTNGRLDGSTERSTELTPRARRSLWHLGADLGG
jgi:hypothetical protein